MAGEYAGFLQNETMRVVEPYIALSVFALVWALFIIKVKFPKLEAGKSVLSDSKGRFKDLFQYPHFWKGVLAQFFYVGAQVGTWSYFISYVKDYTGETEKVAGYFLTGTLVAFGLAFFCHMVYAIHSA